MTESLGTATLELRADATSLASTLTATETGVLSRFKGIAGGVKGAMLGAFAAVAAGALAVGKALYDIGAQFDDAYDKIAVRTGSTGESLEGLKEDFRQVVRSVPTDFDAASTAIGELNSKLGLTGQPLQHVTKQVLELSRLTGTDLQTNIDSLSRLFGDWGIESKDMGDHMDRLFRLSQETGTEVSVLAEQMVQFGSPLRQLGFDFDTTAAMFAKFEKEGVNVQTLMPGLKTGLGNLVQPTDDLAKVLKRLGVEGEEPAVAFRAVMDEMSKMKSDSDRLGLSMQVFGKRAGADMSAAVEEGRFAFSDLIDVMEYGDNTIRQTGRDTMDFTEQWQIFKNRAMLALEPVAIRVFGALAKGMTWLRQHGPPIMAAIKQAFLDVKPALNVLWQLTKVVFKRMVDFVKGAFQQIKGVIQFFSALFKGDFRGMWEGIKNIFMGGLRMLKGIFLDSFLGLLNLVKGFIGKFSKAAFQIGTALFNGIVGVVKGIGGFVIALLKGMINGVISVINTAIDAINYATPGEINIPFAPNIPAIPDIPSIPHLAKGTNFFGGGAAIVGEEGRELVNLPRGSRVHTASETDEILNSGLGDIDVYIGGEKIDERVEVRIRENDRRHHAGYRAGVVGA